jgi:hypothetical protein
MVVLPELSRPSTHIRISRTGGFRFPVEKILANRLIVACMNKVLFYFIEN